MTLANQAILDQLLASGWKEYVCHNATDRLFAKTFPGHAQCECNKPKDKQVEIYWHAAWQLSNCSIPERWTVANIGELPSGKWFRSQIEGLENLDSINQTVEILLHAWDAAHQFDLEIAAKQSS